MQCMKIASVSKVSVFSLLRGNSKPRNSTVIRWLSEPNQKIRKIKEMSVKKAGVIIVGNEILKGQVKDVNASFICKKFHAIGVKVCRIATVPDESEEIAEEVARFSKKYDIVITTGGIGPTHDDITYEAVAAAFGDKIILHAEMAEVIRSYFQGSSDIKSNPALKMALIPQTSKLIYVASKKEKDFHNGLQEGGTKKSFPIVNVRNVYVLPGIMEWLEHAFDHLQKIFENPDVNIYTMVLFVRSTEVQILKELNEAVNRFQKKVVFGSYPSDSSNLDFKTKITLEGPSLDDVTSAYSYLKSKLPPSGVNDDLQCKDAEVVMELTNGNKSLSKAVTHSLQVIESALKQYKPEEIYLSFNGGKDCTVLLHLVWAVTKIMGVTPESLNTVHIRSNGVGFPEVDDFIAKTTQRYNLKVVTLFGPIKTALTELHKTYPGIKAIFMGTRRTDPHSEKMQEFQMCDKDWPPLMRVNPILDWSYSDIWDFLRLLAVPYCKLYDEGYTSIGNPKNTRPNPALKVEKGGRTQFEPAYRLKDESLERQGRN